MLASQESALRSQPSEADYRAATVKQRPTSRRITPAEISVSTAKALHTSRHLTVETYACTDLSLFLFGLLQSLFERQGMTLHGGVLHPGIERGHIPIPKGMSRTKSFGKTQHKQ